MKLKRIVLLAITILSALQLLAKPHRQPVKKGKKKHVIRYGTRARKVSSPYGKHTL